MERRKLFVAVAALVTAACETPTGPHARTLGAGAAFDVPSTSQTQFSGQATVVQANVAGIPITLGGVGPLDPSGGVLHDDLAELEITEKQTGGLLTLRATVGHASAVGQGNKSRSQATVADLALRVAGVSIGATFLGAEASALCDAAGNAVGAASSEIAELTVDGQTYAITGEHTVIGPIAGVTIVLNEQRVDQSGNRADATVTALHVTAEPILGQKVDVIVARAHADITCGGCVDKGDDFHTGGGWFVDEDGSRNHFAVAGGYKNGAPWGHLTYMDKAEGVQLTGGEVEAYIPDPADPSRAVIKGRGRLRDGSTAQFTVTVDDNGEPGRDDAFKIELFDINGAPLHAAGGTLAGGNIQFHDKPSRCPVN